MDVMKHSVDTELQCHGWMARSDCRLPRNIKTFNILMNAAANRNDLNATEHWFQVALTKGIQPDSAMLTLADVTQSSSDIVFGVPP